MEIALVGLVSAVVSALVSAGIAYLSHRQLLGVKMVEIAVGILAHEPDAKNKALRAWATSILAHYSPTAVPITKEARDELRGRRLPVIVEAVGRAVGSSRAKGVAEIKS